MAKKNILVVNAIGGLGNRIRTIAACNGLAALTNRRLQVIWRNNSDVAADFTDIFMPLPDEIELRQPGGMEYVLFWQIPRKKNLYLSSLTQHLRFSKTFSDNFDLGRLGSFGENLLKEVKNCNGNILISSGCGAEFGMDKQIRSLFFPSQNVESLVRKNTEKFNHDTIGVHIRRTDNRLSIDKSPLHLFSEEMRKIIDIKPGTNFFLATDDRNVMENFVKEFGSRIICGDNNASRTSREGIIRGTADMWSLSKTSMILGSFYSSFSEIAATLGNIPLWVLKTD